MKHVSCCGGLAAVLSAIVLVTVAAWAEEAEPSPDYQRAIDQHAAAIAPFVDDETVLVAHLDLERVDVSTVVRWLANFAGVVDLEGEELEAAVAKAEAMVGGWASALKEGGAHSVYAMLSLADVPRGGPFVVVPLERNADGEKVAETLRAIRRGGGFQKVEILHGAVVAGRSASLERLKKMKPAERPRFGVALAAVPASNVQIAFAVGDDQRRALREMFPPLGGMIAADDKTPAALRPVLKSLDATLASVDGDLLADGVQWAGAYVQLPPSSSVGVTFIIASKDATTAGKLHGVLDSLHKTGIDAFDQLGRMVSDKQLKASADVEQLIPLGRVVLAAIEPQLQDDHVSIDLSDRQEQVDALIALVKEPIRLARKEQQRREGMNNLKQIALALNNYHDTKKTFPPAGSRDEKGNKLLSWRVQILPYIEQQALYDQFHLDEPWDSDHNRQLISKMPAVFCSPGSGLQKKGLSNYQAPVGEKLAFTGGEGIPMKEFTDGTSMTIMVVEVDPLHAVVWTKPDDLAVDLEHPFRGITNEKRQEFMATFADGSVHVFDKESLGAKKLRAAFTRNGGEVIDW